MSDPAIEAADRVPNVHGAYLVAVRAAREALTPVQRWFNRHLDELCIRGLDEAAKELAALIFREEEL